MADARNAPLRIAFLPALDPRAGGVFQYSATMADALTEIATGNPALELTALIPGGEANAAAWFEARGWRAVPVTPPPGRLRTLARRIAGVGVLRRAWKRVRHTARERAAAAAPAFAEPPPVARRADLAAWWRAQGVDAVLFPQPHPWAFEAGIPSIVAIHDLEHRLHPEFPEVSADGEWTRREYVLRNCAIGAAAVLVDSDTGKSAVERHYGPFGARSERVHVLPFLPASTLPRTVTRREQEAVRARLGIPGEYIFYPAQFWPHKNHERIIAALVQLKAAEGLVIPAVFCGSHADPVRERNFANLMRAAGDGGVAGQLHVQGFVNDGELAALYAGACALVMPTFFGPTNIPVLEAWAFGCPVITSDIDGVREQAGDAALLVDPRATDALAAAIRRVWTEPALRAGLAERGTRRLAAYGPAEYRERLSAVLAGVRAAAG